MPADIIIYAIVAAGLVIWLRNLLGTNPNEDRKDEISPIKPVSKDTRGLHIDLNLEVIDQQPETPESAIAHYAKDRTAQCAIDNKTAENGLLDIMSADKSFDIKFFFDATQDVFAMVVEAFADHDRDALKDMLSDDVYTAFEGAITAREKAGEVLKSEIHSIRKAHIIEAKLQGKDAKITLRFEAEETTATYDANNALIAGHPDKTTTMNDIWTFARNVKSKDPRWLVVETRGDFDDDNETLPNAGA